MSANDFKIVGKDLLESEKIAKPSMTFWQDVVRRIKMNKVATISFWVIVALTIMAIAGPFMSKFSYREQNLENQFLFGAKAIAKGHYFGTDDFGRDLFTRVWEGTRVSGTRGDGGRVSGHKFQCRGVAGDLRGGGGVF